MIEREREIRSSHTKQPLEIDLDDFIDLGNAYFWFLDLIDPFTGMEYSKNSKLKSIVLGALFERPADGGEVGPTNGKIIADQFQRLKYGDRFFFNHKSTGHTRGLGKVANKNIFR